MNFIELPESGKIINLDAIYTLDHELEDGKTVAIVYLASNRRIYLQGKDAYFLVCLLHDKCHG